jgi:hypothetical protein
MDSKELIGIIMQIRKQTITREVVRMLGMVKCGSLVRGIRGEILADDTRSRSWAGEWLGRQDMQIRAPEPVEDARSILNESYCCQMVRGRWRGISMGLSCFNLEFGEVMVFASRCRRVVCLTGHHVLRRQDGKLMHVTVGPCFNAVGDAAPPLFVTPLLQKYRDEFNVLHVCRCFLTSARRGWVTKSIFGEFFCTVLDEYGKRLNREGNPAILLMENAPTRSCGPALQTFLQLAKCAW